MARIQGDVIILKKTASLGLGQMFWCQLLTQKVRVCETK